VDAEVKRVIDNAYDRAKQTLEANLGLLHQVAAALLERETLTGVDIEMLARGETLPPRSSGAPPMPPAQVAPPALEPKRSSPPLLGGPEPSPA
jgi:cell division protease FtsH